ncbi:MAG: Sec-independent protein translocase TatC [Dehalococcoidia bacterium]|nr:Sec-independent protein translocase TatC [Dehalococcoidia bacterium]
MSNGKELSLLGHLKELRNRLFFSAIAVAVFMVPAFYLTRYVLLFFKSLAPGIELVFTGATEMLATYMKVSIYLALAMALPFVFFQAFMFVSPGLSSREKRYVYVLLPGVVFFFIAGVVFSYVVLLPPALKFLLTFGQDIARPLIEVGNYVSLVSRLLFWTGVVFEIPMVMYFLSKLGVVSARALARGRKIALVGAFILGAMITPTIDPVNQTLISLPIFALYEIGIWLAKLAGRGRRAV